MNNYYEQIKKGFLLGVKKGWGSFLWVLKILLPVSLLTALLEWSGWIYKIDFLFQPLMSWISLPPLAALPLLVGIISGIYGGIGAMVVLPFTKDQMTLMAIFMMICHSLIQEGMIQGKSGLHPLKAILFRIGAAVITVMVAAFFLDPTSPAPYSPGNTATFSLPFFVFLRSWFLANLYLTLKIFGIILSILVFLEILKVLGWIRQVVKIFSPFLRLLGLSQGTGILWITGAFFGLIYGAAVIVEEIKDGHLAKEEVEKLHLSIGINHSFIEDPILFMALGLNFFWLFIPRLLAAILVVRVYSFGKFIIHKLLPTYSP